jgi:hypothetical protein
MDKGSSRLNSDDDRDDLRIAQKRLRRFRDEHAILLAQLKADLGLGR